MPSGDGLIVRIRPHCGALSPQQAGALADLAQGLGNGHIDLTRRANLQIRGLTEANLPELHEALRSLGLLDRDAEAEARRNIMVSPLAGLDPTEWFDVRPIAAALDHALVHDPDLGAMHAKFGMLVDGGGSLSIAGERADICLAAIGKIFAFGLGRSMGTEWLGSVAPERALEVAIAACHESAVDVRGMLSPLEATPQPGRRRLGVLKNAVGIAAPFGRLHASQLRRLTHMAVHANGSELRLSPWRSIYIGTRDEAVLEGARDAGLIVDDHHPLLRIDACPGTPDCMSSSVDARGDAQRLAMLAMQHGHQGSIHVSGCAKRCARSAPADLTLIGEGGRYRVGRRLMDSADFSTLFAVSADA
jgi:precorrin-3B synthase